MNVINILQTKFPDIKIKTNKVEVFDLIAVIKFLKNTPELSFDSLFSTIAVDYIDYTELIYHLVSVNLNKEINISVKIKDTAPSLTHFYSSAYFDECEIFDMFGIKFIGNKNLKRLFMPASWQGYPLKKNYILNDERLIWNE